MHQPRWDQPLNHRISDTETSELVSHRHEQSTLMRLKHPIFMIPRSSLQVGLTDHGTPVGSIPAPAEKASNARSADKPDCQLDSLRVRIGSSRVPAARSRDRQVLLASLLCEFTRHHAHRETRGIAVDPRQRVILEWADNPRTRNVAVVITDIKILSADFSEVALLIFTSRRISAIARSVVSPLGAIVRRLD